MATIFDPATNSYYDEDTGFDVPAPSAPASTPSGSSGSGGSTNNLLAALLKGATDAYGASANANAKARQAATAKAKLSNYLPWVIGGAALLLVIALITRR